MTSVKQDSVQAVVLAGDREGGSALARAFARPAGVLVPVAGAPCIEHVLAALRGSTRIGGGVVVGPAARIASSEDTLVRLLAGGDYRWVEPAAGPSASALRGVAAAGRFPVLVTAGDHALLDAAIIDGFCRDADAVDAEFVAGLVPHADVRAAFPESRRTVLRFSDGAFCGSNLFLVRRQQGTRALELWRDLEAGRKRPWRVAAKLGPRAILRYLSRTLPVDEAFELLSRRARCRIGYCVVPAARAAVDVDSAADRLLAERVLGRG